jgi:hypothetical protein
MSRVLRGAVGVEDSTGKQVGLRKFCMEWVFGRESVKRFECSR